MRWLQWRSIDSLCPGCSSIVWRSCQPAWLDGVGMVDGSQHTGWKTISSAIPALPVANELLSLFSLCVHTRAQQSGSPRLSLDIVGRRAMAVGDRGGRGRHCAGGMKGVKKGSNPTELIQRSRQATQTTEENSGFTTSRFGLQNFRWRELR